MGLSSFDGFQLLVYQRKQGQQYQSGAKMEPKWSQNGAISIFGGILDKNKGSGTC
jgi:hypothetical protein